MIVLDSSPGAYSFPSNARAQTLCRPAGLVNTPPQRSRAGNPRRVLRRAGGPRRCPADDQGSVRRALARGIRGGPEGRQASLSPDQRRVVLLVQVFRAAGAGRRGGVAVSEPALREYLR